MYCENLNYSNICQPGCSECLYNYEEITIEASSLPECVKCSSFNATVIENQCLVCPDWCQACENSKGVIKCMIPKPQNRPNFNPITMQLDANC